LLFSATFGLSARPTEIGFKRYSTLLLPKWMIRLANHRRSSEVIAGIPADAVPPMGLVDYSAIDSDLGGLPYPGQQRAVDRRLAEAGFHPYMDAACHC
jgi:hypothetical protein